MAIPTPGPDGEALPPRTQIFRVGNNKHVNPPPNPGARVLPALFELSSDDKKSPCKRLSVWVEALTVADQAWDFMNCKKENTHVICLNVDDIRAMKIEEGFVALEVEWEQALNQDKSPNLRPGAEGHCGICNLEQGVGVPDASAKRRRLRLRLADIAKFSPVPAQHKFPEEHVREVAYYISRMPEAAGRTCEAHWISAIRQLRRGCVREHESQSEPATVEELVNAPWRDPL